MSAAGNEVCVDDFEKIARSILPKNAFDYYRSGSCKECSLRINRSAFEKLRIIPRVLRDVSACDASVTMLGSKVSFPIAIAPTAMQRMAHPDGECATARAAGDAGVVFTLSTIATSSIEEVAATAPHTIKWFQLYIYRDRDLTLELVRRAERAGFKALVLTVDAPVFGIRYADMRNKFALPAHLKLGNFTGKLATDASNSDTESGSGINEYVANMFSQSVTWEDVKWLKSITSLPLVLKGILSVKDAQRAIDLGVEGIQVSNHGGRQVDGTPAPVEALPGIAAAVAASGARCEVFVDGGLRGGGDAFRALALGARAAFVGRPAVWALATGGEAGVRRMLALLQREFVHALALAGCARVADIEKDMVVHESSFCKL